MALPFETAGVEEMIEEPEKALDPPCATLNLSAASGSGFFGAMATRTAVAEFSRVSAHPVRGVRP
jgi:hypothetical protein